MLIGFDSSPCSLSLRNRSTLCSTTKCYQNKSDLKIFLYKNLFFFQYLLFFQSQSCLLESTAAIFRQSSGYVWFFAVMFFPIQSQSFLGSVYFCLVNENSLNCRSALVLLCFLFRQQDFVTSKHMSSQSPQSRFDHMLSNLLCLCNFN